MKKIRTAFIFDPAPSFFAKEGIDGEVRGVLMELDALCDLTGDQHFPVTVAYKAEAIGLDFFRKSFDLVIIDYGGLSTMGAMGSGIAQVDAACRYAEEHLGCLLVIWTGYTANIYEDELREQFGHLDNIVCRYKDSSSVYGNLDGDPEFIAKFKAWFAGPIAEAAKAPGIDSEMAKVVLKAPGRRK
jgi:hypothetical protein